ncbi:ribosomal protein S2, flavodoxin-like domain-containing protein [Aspergillus filifer]
MPQAGYVVPSPHQKFERKKRNSSAEPSDLKHAQAPDKMIVRQTFARQSRQLLALNRPVYIPRRFQSTETQTPTRVDTIDFPSIEEPGTRASNGDAIVPAITPGSNSGVQKRTHRSQFQKLGSVVTNAYEPEDLIRNPPSVHDVTLELLLASQTHLGHSTSRWNPRNSRYIFGIRDGVHIISLDLTAAYLRRAAKVVEQVAFYGGLILFVGTRPGQKRIVVRAAELAQSYHVFERWIPGSLTNGEQILGHCERKVVNALDEELPEEGGILAETATLKPDLVICLNPLENEPLLHECGLNNIPTIGIIDTDADASRVTYPIPANDDSLRSVGVIAGVLGRSGQVGQKRRLEKAKSTQEKGRQMAGESPQRKEQAKDSDDFAKEEDELD